MKILTAALAAFLVFAPLGARAQQIAGSYIGLGLGDNILFPEKVMPKAAGVFFANGYAATGAAGFGFGDGLRVELQGQYERNGAHMADISGGKVAVAGHELKYGVFLNAYYDANVGVSWFHPFIGAGLGWELVDWKVGGDPDPGFTIEGTRGALGVQAMIGASFPVPDMPGLSAEVEDRMLVVGRRHYNGGRIGYEADNAVIFGFRFAFGGPPDLPEPVRRLLPAPEPQS